tara:strand:+ start:511 stop:672 length:162 start_codon:yes stop_codon:yes gene_type:complete
LGFLHQQLIAWSKEDGFQKIKNKTQKYSFYEKYIEDWIKSKKIKGHVFAPFES